jgi:hypothetical protein
MILLLRKAIVKICELMLLVRVGLLWVSVHTLKLISDMTSTSADQQLELFRQSSLSFGERCKSLLPELQNFERLTEERKLQVVAARSSLVEEGKNLVAAVRNLAFNPGPGATAIIYVATRAKDKAEGLQRRNESLLRIISRIRDDNFYCDTLLWLVGCREEMLGDLNEEYALRSTSDGKSAANAWYYDQAITTLRDWLWKKIERLAAVGALIDLVSRWIGRGK